MKKKFLSLAGIFACIVGLFTFQCLASRASTPADGKDKREREFFIEYRYMLAFQWEYGWSDIANYLMEELRKKYPEPRYIASLDSAHFDKLVLEGKFDEILVLIGHQAENNSYEIWRIKNVLADVYLLQNRYEDFLNLYQNFVKTFPGIIDGEQDDYLLRSVKILQMIQRAVDMEDGPDRNTLLVETEKANDKLLEIVDPFFGLAVVAKAQIMSLRDDDRGAQNMVAQYMQIY